MRRVAGKEMVSTFRDRRTLVSSIVLPLVMIPLFLIGLPLTIGRAVGGEQEARQTVGVQGLERAPDALLASLRADTPRGRGVNLVRVDDATESVRAGEVEAAIAVPASVPTSAGGETVPIGIHFKQSSTKAQVVYGKLSEAVEAYGRSLVAARLAEAGLPERTLQPVVAQPVNADTPAERASGAFAFIIPMFILQWILVGGQATAIDATAGEKERGTLEALLVTPVSRLEVVLGKLLAVVAFSVMATVFSMAGLVLTGLVSRVVLPSAMSGIASGGPEDLGSAFGGNLSLDAGGFLVLLAVGLTVALFVSALLLAVCVFARSFKEAQTYVAPLAILIILPAVMLQFADFLNRDASIYAVPIVGSMLAILDVVKGDWDGTRVLVAMGMNLLLTGAAVLFALSSFRREQVLFRN